MLTKSKSLCIKYARIFAAFLIFMCHVFSISDKSIVTAMSLFLNVGVYIFLFVSGVIYSKRNVAIKQTIFQFSKQRYVRIAEPIVIWMLAVVIINRICGYSITIKQVLSHLFNLEIFLPQIYGMDHLWFVSVIMLCYILKWLIDYFNVNLHLCLVILIGILAVFFLLDDTNWITYIICIITFTVGLLCGGGQVFYVHNASIITSVLMITISVFIRLIGWRLLDGSTIYYIVVGFTQMIIGISFFFCLMRFAPSLERMYKNEYVRKSVDWLNSINYEFYIVHYLYICGSLAISKYVQNNIMMFLSTVLLSIASAQVLHSVLQIIHKTMEVHNHE